MAQSKQILPPGTTERRQAHERTVREVATELGVSVDVVYYWVSHRYLDARRGRGGSWLVNFDADAEAECRRRIATSTQIKPKTKPKASR